MWFDVDVGGSFYDDTLACVCDFSLVRREREGSS